MVRRRAVARTSPPGRLRQFRGCGLRAASVPVLGRDGRRRQCRRSPGRSGRTDAVRRTPRHRTGRSCDVIGELIAIALGLLVGLSLGALGGGGSTLAVPILVFVAGLEAQDATTASLLVVGVASAFGVVGHFRAGNVRLGAGLAFGAAGILGSRVGTLVNRSV